LRLTARIIFSQLNTCGHSPYITSSLTRGWVCHLQLLLALASAFIFEFESCGIQIVTLIKSRHGPRSTENTDPLLLWRPVITQLSSKQSRRGPHETPFILVAYFYSCVFIGPIPSNGCPVLSRIAVRITQQRLFAKNPSARECVYRGVA
jgi:hypothetical protein